MRFRKAAPLAALLCMAALLCGCTQERLYARDLTAANTAQQNAFNQVMLLNVLRSRDRQPRAYSRFSALRGAASLSPGIGLSTPFGPGAPANGLTNAWAGSLSQSDDMAPQDDQDFYRGVLTPVSNAVWSLYQDQNWPPDLLFHVFVEQIKVSSETFTELNRAADEICAKDGAGDALLKWQCPARAAPDCPVWKQKTLDQVLIVLSNEPSDKCERGHFEAFAFTLLVLGFRIDKDGADAVGPVLPASAFKKDIGWAWKLHDGDISVKPVTDDKGKVIGYALKQSGGYAAHLLNYKPRGATDDKAQVLVAPKSEAVSAARHAGAGSLKIFITPRSADGMVYYLGEAVRAADKGEMPTMIRTSSGPRPLIRVLPGCAGDPAVCVTFRDTGYSIAYDDGSMGLQTFELMKQVFALYNKGSAPTTAAVTIVP